jgi:hypothetical protein
MLRKKVPFLDFITKASRELIESWAFSLRGVIVSSTMDWNLDVEKLIDESVFLGK